MHVQYVVVTVYGFKYLRRRVQQASELMLDYGCISWNVPGQHRYPEIHGLLEQTDYIRKSG